MIKSTDKKSDIINYLIQEYDIKREEINDKTKEELWAMLKSLNEGNMDNLVEEVVAEKNMGENDENANLPPLITDYAWHDYVMSAFEKDELVDGNPTVDGMRRVCELLIGDIIEINSKVVQIPTQENERRATVESTIIIDCLSGKTKAYSGCADVYYGNADGIYSKHPVALAETRAEGRALKRALRLRKVISAEEISKDDENSELIVKSKDPINDNQKTFIGFACSKDRTNINVEKFIKSRLPNVKKIGDVKYTEAQELVKVLDEYNRKQDTIPEEIKGFDSNWVVNFS